MAKLFKRLFCALRGHGGIAPKAPGEQKYWYCKRCGADVELI